MSQDLGLTPDFTILRRKGGLSTEHPVRIWSWMDLPGPAREIHPGDPDFPGWRYGDRAFTPSQKAGRAHSHEFYQVCIIRKGLCAHRLSEAAHEIRAPAVVVLPPRTVHLMHGIGELELTIVRYLAEWLTDDLSAYWGEAGFVPLFLAGILFRGPATHRGFEFAIGRKELRALDDEIASIGRESVEEAPSRALLKAGLIKLLIYLARVYSRQSGAEAGLAFRGEVFAALDQIEQFIAGGEPFHAGHLAESAGVSTGHFSALFKAATGWAPMDYYQRRRTQHASSLLLEPQYTVTDVAYLLGYCDAAHFSHLFKKHQGQTPSAYRESFAQVGRLPASQGDARG